RRRAIVRQPPTTARKGGNRRPHLEAAGPGSRCRDGAPTARVGGNSRSGPGVAYRPIGDAACWALSETSNHAGDGMFDSGIVTHGQTQQARGRLVVLSALIVCAAIAVRAVHLGTLSLWSDELFSLYYADLFDL